MSADAKNYLVVIVGRGKVYLGLAQNVSNPDSLANSCQTSVDQGFEVYIYSIEASPLGQVTFFPPEVVNLRKHFHLFDDTERYTDEARSIIMGLSRHSITASKRYINIVQSILAKELDGLNQDDPPGDSLNNPSGCTYHTQGDEPSCQATNDVIDADKPTRQEPPLSGTPSS